MSALAVRAEVAARGLDVEFAVGAGEVLAILGPNGAGKSTALHVIAGLIAPDAGTVRLGERQLTDTASGVHVPTHDRRVGLLLQEPLLFPHLDVLANVGFAARYRHQGRAEARATARHWLERVDGVDWARRKPRALSGGQAQRVAIARALAGAPEALLLDEPMAGLDVSAAAAIRAVLREVLVDSGRCAVLVTHDLLDVLTLADRVLVVEGGRVAESGPATAVLGAPRSTFAAQIAGVNLVNGIIEAPGVLRAADGRRWHGQSDGAPAVGERAVALFRPAAVSVYSAQPDGSPRNVVAANIAELDARGSTVRVRGAVQGDGAPGLAADVTPAAAAELHLVPGQQVWLAVKAHEVELHPLHASGN